MMRNNYAASGLKGIRVAVGMYNRRNGNLEAERLPAGCSQTATLNQNDLKTKTPLSFITRSVRWKLLPAGYCFIFYAKQMQAFSEQQLDASCLNQHTKEVIAEQCANRKSRLLRIKNKLESYEKEVDATIARLAM